MTSIIGYDPGFGNTKVCLSTEDNTGYLTNMIQSSVVKPISIGNAAVGLKTAIPALKVSVASQEYCVGENAWQWGKSLSNLDYLSLGSAEKKALFYGAISQLVPPGDYTFDLLVVGLPVPLLKDTDQADAVLKALKTYKGTQNFSVDSGTYKLDIKRIKYLAQPVGTFAGWLLDDNNHIVRGKGTSEAAILDLGMNTLDLYVVKGDMVQPNFIGGGKVGVRRLLERIAKEGFCVEELDSELRAGRLKVSQPILDSWLSEVMGIIEPTWPVPSRFSAIIPTGGGAAILNHHLEEALVSKGGFVFWPKDPILANAIGLWKWGNHVFDS